MFKTHFLITIKFGGHKKIKVTAHAPPCLRAWAEPSPESIPSGPSCLCRGG